MTSLQKGSNSTQLSHLIAKGNNFLVPPSRNWTLGQETEQLPHFTLNIKMWAQLVPSIDRDFRYWTSKQFIIITDPQTTSQETLTPLAVVPTYWNWLHETFCSLHPNLEQYPLLSLWFYGALFFYYRFNSLVLSLHFLLMPYTCSKTLLSTSDKGHQNIELQLHKICDSRKGRHISKPSKVRVR